MAKILNIDTSTEICSVVLAKNGDIIAMEEETRGNSHARLLTVLVEKVTKESGIELPGLDAVCVSKGPGSYTGLRIGTSVAKGLCYALDIPLIAINTLEALANGFLIEHGHSGTNALVCPMIDARRMEVYTALYDGNMNTIKNTGAEIIESDFLHEELDQNQVYFFGNGALKCAGTIQHPNARFVENIHTSARHLVALSEQAFTNQQFEDVAYFEPFYLKEFLATRPKKLL